MDRPNLLLLQVDEDRLYEIVSDAVNDRLRNINSQPTDKETNKYLTREKVAELLHITLPTLHSLTQTGRIKAYKIGGRVLYKAKDVDNALKEISYK